MSGNRVFLGIIDSKDLIHDQLSGSDPWKSNKIGGFPVLSPLCNKETISMIKSLICEKCGHILTFILQIDAPIDDSLTDRVLYLFVCRESGCDSNKYIALRSVTKCRPSNRDKQIESDFKNKCWIETESEWDSDQSQKPAKSCETNDTIDCREELTDLIIDESLAYFKPFYVSVIEEPTEEEIRDDKHIKQLIKSYNSNTNNDKSGSNSIENYEQNYINTIYGNDAISYKFFKRLSLLPQQIIRYEWDGNPLLNSQKCEPIVSKCNLCGSNRTFELQLMPALINNLKPISDQTNCGIDFGTVLIYTCSKNCVPQPNLISIEQSVVFLDPDNELIEKIIQ